MLTEDAPISVALVLDSSGSMNPWFETAQRVVLQFFRTANRADEFLLVQVKGRAWLVSGFTHATGHMEAATQLSAPKGRTALLDGIYLAAGQLRTARNRRRVIIAITDGLDNHSRYSEKAVANALAEADAQVFGIQQDRPDYWGIMQKLARGTGGRVFGGFAAEKTAEIIWQEVRLEHVLTYRPTNTRREGRWRKIKVKLRSKPFGHGWSVNARSGYYEPPL